MVEIKKVREDKRGIKTITIPRESEIKGGDYVAVKKVNLEDFKAVEGEEKDEENANE